MLVRAADVCTVIGDAADATSLYEQLRPRAHFVIHDGALICYGSASRALGALALQRGEHALAASHLSDALAMNTRIGHRPELARTRLALAQLALAQGRAEEARERLAEVRTEASAMGMTKLA
jgi:uncharacterized protein HemY